MRLPQSPLTKDTNRLINLARGPPEMPRTHPGGEGRNCFFSDGRKEQTGMRVNKTREKNTQKHAEWVPFTLPERATSDQAKPDMAALLHLRNSPSSPPLRRRSTKSPRKPLRQHKTTCVQRSLHAISTRRRSNGVGFGQQSLAGQRFTRPGQPTSPAQTTNRARARSPTNSGHVRSVRLLAAWRAVSHGSVGTG